MRCCLFKNLWERFRTESPPRRGRLVSQFFGHRGESPMGRVGERVGDGDSGRWEKIFLLPSFLFPRTSSRLTSLKLKNRPIRLPEVGGHVVKLPQFHSVYGQFLRRVQPLLV